MKFDSVLYCLVDRRGNNIKLYDAAINLEKSFFKKLEISMLKKILWIYPSAYTLKWEKSSNFIQS